jgi:hypothetical protein
MIDKCPACGYSLVGLPAEHCCPECGVEYERDAVLFGEPRAAWIVLACANGVMLIVSVAGWFWRPSVPAGPWLIALFATMCIGWIWRLRKARHLILVSRRNIRILGRGAGPEVYRIPDVGGISWDSTTGDILIQRLDGAELTRIKRRFLGSSRRARRVVDAVRQHAQVGKHR